VKPTYHIVSHSHWDREWYKTFEQFRSMLVNMVDDLLYLLKSDPSFACFTLDGQTVILEDYLAVRPEREQEIRHLVAEGRLVIGPWYVLPDEFLVSAEATVRNLLTGTRMAEDFGGEMKVGYIPDSFGHIAMMPAILKGFDIDTALVYRGFGGEPGQKTSEYRWKAPDGTTGLMIHLYSNGYSGGYFHQETDEEIVGRFKGLKRELDARATTSHRLLLNGGDHHWPDPKLPRTLDVLRANCDGGFMHSTVQKYVEAVKREINGVPEIEGELRFGYRYAFAVLSGVYSSRMYIKQKNWDTQNLLQRYVEPLNAFARSEGMSSQMPLIHHAWKTLLKNHPHDSICGCSIDPVHREMMTRFKAVEDVGTSVMQTCLEHLIPYDDRHSKDDCSLFFFNPSPFNRTEVVQTEVNFYLQDIVVGLNPDVAPAAKLPPVSGFVLVDQEGRSVPYQVLERKEAYDITYSKYNYPKQTYADKFTILVDAVNVPSMGFKGLRVQRSDRFPRFPSRLKTGKNFIENDYLRVGVNAKGEVEVRDKTTGNIFPGLNVFEDSGDVGDEYNYSYPHKDKWVLSNKAKAKVRLIERGPLRAALQVRLTMSLPESATPDQRARSRKEVKFPITTTISLTPYSHFVEIVTIVENTAKDHRFRALFPAGVDTDRVVADSQFCTIERWQKEYDVREFTIEHPAKVAPMQRFVTVKGGKRALTLFSDGLPEYELKLDGKGTVALTFLRSVGLLAGEHLITRPGGKGGWHNETPDAQCPGGHSFRYAVLPDSAKEPESAMLLNEMSEYFHLPLLPVRRKNPVELSLQGGMLSMTSHQLVFSALKESESGEGVILRVYNTSDTGVRDVIRFGLKVRNAWQAALNEEVTERLAVHEGHEVPVQVPPAGIMTLKIEFEQR
jgi:alpha-mannosidase